MNGMPVRVPALHRKRNDRIASDGRVRAWERAHQL